MNDEQQIILIYLTDNTDDGALRLKRIEAEQYQQNTEDTRQRRSELLQTVRDQRGDQYH